MSTHDNQITAGSCLNGHQHFMGIIVLLLSAAIKQIEAMTKIDHGADDEGHFDLPCSNAVVSPFFGLLWIAFPEVGSHALKQSHFVWEGSRCLGLPLNRPSPIFLSQP